MSTLRSVLPCTLILLFTTVFLTTAASAQERGGTITGTVTDAAHHALPGARVDVAPHGLPAVTDQEGRFTEANLKPGDYTVTISYVGLSPDTEKVSVRPGEVSRIEATLQVPRVSEEVSVSAERPRGEAAAINEQRTAANIVQILPAEVITSLPNTNVADAVGRLPSVSLERDEGEGKYVQIRGTDPRLSNLTINGVNVPSPESGARNVKLDIIPSDLVGAIEVHKTLSADQEGDAIGGSVNLVTKVPTDQRYLNMSAMGGYTNIVGGRGLDQFGATYGSRFGAGRKWGVLIGGTYDWNGRGIDDIEPSPDVVDLGQGPIPVYTAIDLREYRYYRTRVGAAGGVDYRGQSGWTAQIRGLFSNFKNYGDRWIYAPGAGDFLTPTTTDSNGTMDASVQNRRPNEQIFSLSGGGKRAFRSFFLDYDLSAGRSRRNRLAETSVGFSGPSNVAYGIDASNPFVPIFNVLNGVNVFDPTQFVLSSYSVANERSRQQNYAGSLNVGRAYAGGARPGLLQAGFRVRDAHKVNNIDDPTYTPTGAPALTMNAVLGNFSNPNYYFGNYTLGPLADLDKIIAFQQSTPSAFTLNIDRTRQRDSSNYTTDERVIAGYVMNTFDFVRSRLQAGVRVEATHSDYTGYHVTLDSKGHYVSTSPVSGASNYTDALPSVQYKFGFDPNTDVRLVYGMGIARPNFGDLPPYVLESDKKKSISVGNPALLPTRANNFDVLVERFFEPLGVVQAGAFYKALKDPIYGGFQTKVAGGIYDGFTQSQPINGPSAHVGGLELAWQQHLTFLPGIAGGLGVLANYSYATSKATVPGRSDTPALLRQAPNNWNLGVTYDRRGLSARLGVTHNDASIFAYNYRDGADGGIKGPLGDQYLYPHTQIDAQGTYMVMPGFQLVVSLLNLNNEVFGFYQGSPQYQVQREFYNRTVSVGVRLTR
jgi:TonB-dependent receptor